MIYNGKGKYLLSKRFGVGGFMRKLYVFVANDIHVLGGAEIYIYGKSVYLEKEGWAVRVLFPGKSSGKCQISYLDQYLSGGIEDLAYVPYRLCKKHRESVLQKMVQHLKADVYECIIIESHYDLASFWGELLAEKIRGKHYIFCITEEYRGMRHYESNLDFYRFKLDRKELIATPKIIQLLFDGYMGINKASVDYPILAVEADPVQDVDNDKLKMIAKADYTICSIGRTDKRYIPYAMHGVKEFAEAYPEKKINLVIIGNENNIDIKEFDKYHNINLICLGVVFPIPRLLFKKVDVVIAAAQTALFAAYENTYTIVADVASDKTPGVLGIDTLDAWYGEGRKGKNYKDVLEDVLIFNKYRNLEIKMPERKSAEYYYALQWKYFALSSQNKEYYTERLSVFRNKDWVAVFPYWAVKKDSKVLLYGFGKIGFDYYRQIKATGYCYLSGIVDSNIRNDNRVISPQIGLQSLDYDVVVVAVSDRSNIDDIKMIIKNYAKGKTIIHDVKLFVAD